MTYTKPFERCYEDFPLKKGKFQAQKTWTKLNDSGDLPDAGVIAKAIEDQKKERTYLRQQNRFAPPWKHFSTWLNGRCWSDECELGRVAKVANNQPGNGVDTMDRAYNILTGSGEAKFKEFCKATKMPEGDIEAVKFKFQGIFNINRLARRIG